MIRPLSGSLSFQLCSPEKPRRIVGRHARRRSRSPIAVLSRPRPLSQSCWSPSLSCIVSPRRAPESASRDRYKGRRRGSVFLTLGSRSSAAQNEPTPDQAGEETHQPDPEPSRSFTRSDGSVADQDEPAPRWRGSAQRVVEIAKERFGIRVAYRSERPHDRGRPSLEDGTRAAPSKRNQSGGVLTTYAAHETDSARIHASSASTSGLARTTT